MSEWRAYLRVRWRPVAGRAGRTQPVDRDPDVSSFPLNGRSVKLVPEKDGTTSEAQTGAPLAGPEWAGRPAGEDGTQNGRVTPAAPSPLHPRLQLPPPPPHWPPRARGLPSGTGAEERRDSLLLNTCCMPSKTRGASYFLMLTTPLKLDGDSSILGMKKLRSGNVCLCSHS